MINTWGELFTAIKNWFSTPVDFAHKAPEEIEIKTEDLLRPQPYNPRWAEAQRGAWQQLSAKYMADLRARKRAGEFITEQDRYRLMMDEHVRGINDALNNLPDDGEAK